MLKSYKTEIDPNQEQVQKINRTIGVCRYVYNMYLAYNIESHKNGEGFVSAMVFSKHLNGYIKDHQELSWIKEVSSKSVKKSIMDCEKSFKKFFNGTSRFPRFKKKHKSDTKMYFVKNDANSIIRCERHRIKVPTLGWIKIKEYGYIPTNPETHIIKSGTISKKAGRYYVSVLVEESVPEKPNLMSEGIGIDLGIKDFATISSGVKFQNINKTQRVRKLNKRLNREHKKLARKYESLKIMSKSYKFETNSKNIQKQIQKLQKTYQRLNHIRTDYINKCVNDVVKTKPSYITIEDLNVRGMMKNRYLSKSIANQRFYEFRVKLEAKCKTLGIELRIADRFYPSSKTCHQCGCVKSDLKLSDREYICPECGYRSDRDYNASLNLRDTQAYKIA